MRDKIFTVVVGSLAVAMFLDLVLTPIGESNRICEAVGVVFILLPVVGVCVAVLVVAVLVCWEAWTLARDLFLLITGQKPKEPA